MTTVSSILSRSCFVCCDWFMGKGIETENQLSQKSLYILVLVILPCKRPVAAIEFSKWRSRQSSLVIFILSASIHIFWLRKEICDLGALTQHMPECAVECGKWKSRLVPTNFSTPQKQWRFCQASLEIIVNSATIAPTGSLLLVRNSILVFK